ncbi:putative malate dehydrogenase 1B [Anoplophora glabripennis]|uniref:putative malate dehydrogenase 1B n=1 Tax=Anoplophora glabripennis TaxID=217634 RepID=UPI000C7609A2|nr:putative malate dehydrogenase 1B [Anoplophora glabripennis]
MPYFIINGYAGCPNFGHAIIVAQYLSERLPNFEFKKVEVAPTEWGDHVMDINKCSNWYLTKSPVIWKEIHQWGSKRYLLGGLGEFWEYVYCYYGLESIIPKADLRNLAANNLKVRGVAERLKYTRIISIIGATSLVTTLLLKELFEVPNLKKRDGIIVRLFDENHNDERKYSMMEDMAIYYNSLSIFGRDQIVFIVNNLEELLDNCDLLIIVEDFRPNNQSQYEVTLKRCFAKMNYLSEAVNSSKHRSLRIIFSGQGPLCFLATCLVEFCTTVRPSDIVVLAADEGLSYISVLSEKTGIPVSKISAPPVWGFIGIHSFVDEAQTVFKADVYRPNLRSLTAPHGSTLPLGTIKSELRLMSYLITDHDEVVRTVEERKKKITKLQERPTIFRKIRSVISLLKLWYAEQPSDDIISLGVCSDGSFDIPAGMVFAQPAKLDSRFRWLPFAEYPLMDDFTRAKIKECKESSSRFLEQSHLLHHMCKDSEDISSNPH